MFAHFSRPIAIIIRFAKHMRLRRDQFRAQRVLDSLPEHLRKDIGWPDRELEREARVLGMNWKSKVWDAEAMLARTECPSLFGSSDHLDERKAA